jgi:hypothetical protein
MSDEPDTFFHYTDTHGFHGIVTSKELWLHDAYFSNDYTEHRLILEKAVAQLKALGNEPRNRAFCEKLEASLSSVSIHPHVCCFSSEPDLLSQWRAYSDDGGGFAIGFSADAIERLCISHLNRRTLISFHQVEYNTCTQELQLNEALAKALARYLKRFTDDKDADHRYEGLEIATAHSEIWTLAARCKNRGFSEEREHRLVVMPKANDFPPPPFDVSEMCFRPSGQHLVPYFPISFKAEDIVGIRLGPRNHEKEVRHAIEMFLGKNGFDLRRIEIKNSAATYGRR